MKLFIENNYNLVSNRAFSLFTNFLPETRVLGLATGNSVVGLYDRICNGFRRKELSLKGVSTLNLDEYFRINRDHPQSFWSYMTTSLFSRTDLQPENIHFPISEGDPVEAAESYNHEIDEVGCPDFQILGIGRNGHIGFNEPGSPRSARTRVIVLSHETAEVIAPPSEFAITMGLKDILESKRIMLIASGREKAEAVSRMIYSPLTYLVPATYLQEHPNVYVVIDREAGALLDLKSFESRSEKFGVFKNGNLIFDI